MLKPCFIDHFTVISKALLYKILLIKYRFHNIYTESIGFIAFTI